MNSMRSSAVRFLLLAAISSAEMCQVARAEFPTRFFVGEPRVPEFVRFPKTTFAMGSPVKDVRSRAFRQEEKPQRETTVGAFGLSRFLVTAEEYSLFLNEQGNDGYMLEEGPAGNVTTIVKKKGKYVARDRAERCPATMITWRGAEAYAAWLAKKLSLSIRLPTEAEWELAARGKELRAFPWGNEKPFVVHEIKPLLPGLLDDDSIEIVYREDLKGESIPLGEYFFGGPPRSNPPKPWPEAPVGSYPRNATPEGVYDMVGYWFGQWCADEYAPYDVTSKSANPEADAGRNVRVQRGMALVPISGNAAEFYSKQDNIPLRLVLPLGDARWEMETTARTWSRVGRDANRDGGLVRVAITIPKSP